jgi:hypothetical protein
LTEQLEELLRKADLEKHVQYVGGDYPFPSKKITSMDIHVALGEELLAIPRNPFLKHFEDNCSDEKKLVYFLTAVTDKITYFLDAETIKSLHEASKEMKNLIPNITKVDSVRYGALITKYFEGPSTT